MKGEKFSLEGREGKEKVIAKLNWDARAASV
jgi:hypothetical protein